MGCWKVLSSGRSWGTNWAHQREKHLGYPMGMHWDCRKVLRRERNSGNHWDLHWEKNLDRWKERSWGLQKGSWKANHLVPQMGWSLVHRLLKDSRRGRHWGRNCC